MNIVIHGHLFQFIAKSITPLRTMYKPPHKEITNYAKAAYQFYEWDNAIFCIIYKYCQMYANNQYEVSRHETNQMT